MIRSMYSGVSGLKNHQTKMDVIGNNVANVNTYGYKAQRASFSDMFSQTLNLGTDANDETGVGTVNPTQIGLGVQLAAINTNWSTGSFQNTEVETNVMIAGDGFFMVQGPNEEVFCTRLGNFEMDEAGNFVLSGLGYKVLNADGEAIEIPEEYTNIAIDKFGQISGLNEENAREDIDGAILGVINFKNPSKLEKCGNSLFKFDVENEDGNMIQNDENKATFNGTGEIMAGGLEMSNVSLADEFTDMIVTQRGYQANSRVITVSDTLLEELVNLKR